MTMPLGLHVLFERVVNVYRMAQAQAGQSVHRLRLGISALCFDGELLNNGVWSNSATQHQEALMANSLPPSFERTIELPLPEEGNEWRIEVGASRVLGNFEMSRYRMVNRLKLRYPFAPDFQVYSETNSVVKSPNQSRQPTAAPPRHSTP